MNAQQFQIELDSLYRRAFQDGVCQGQMTPIEAIGAADFNADVFKSNVKMAISRMQQPTIIPANKMPTMGGGK